MILDNIFKKVPTFKQKIALGIVATALLMVLSLGKLLPLIVGLGIGGGIFWTMFHVMDYFMDPIEE